jgi:hypothetical protein
MEDRRMSSFPLATGFPVFAAAPRDAGWPEIDLSILEEKRGAVPPFPLDLLPQPWRDWVSDTASSAGAPTDYVVQAVLAALAGLCGAGVAVRITPVWSEPLVLWQAVVGEPSSGKSSALASMRRLLGSIEAERRVHDDVRQEAHAERVKQAGSNDAFVRSQVVVGDDPPLEAIAEIVSGNPRGVILWRDDPAWLAQLGEAGNDGSELANARIAQDDDALKMLQRISRLARTPDDPLVLFFDQRGVEAFDGFLVGLHADRRGTEGLEAAWLGKGRSTVARLAGALELLAWSGSDAPGLPGHIGREQVEAAAALWTGYFRPHARVVFDRAAPTDFERRVRRVARWLRDGRAGTVSREDIRRRALGQTVNASDADQVLQRLGFLGFVRPDRSEDRAFGRPAKRWQVNPVLGEA